MRIKPGEKRSTARTAARRVAEMREADAGLRQAIDIGRMDLAAVATEIAETHIVGHHDDDVRTPPLWGRRFPRNTRAHQSGGGEFDEISTVNHVSCGIVAGPPPGTKPLVRRDEPR